MKKQLLSLVILLPMIWSFTKSAIIKVALNPKTSIAVTSLVAISTNEVKSQNLTLSDTIMFRGSWYSPIPTNTVISGTNYLFYDGKPDVVYEYPVYTWNMVQDKPSFSSVAFSGSYLDLNWSPTIPTWGYGIHDQYGQWQVDTSIIAAKSFLKRQETYSGTTNGSGVYTVTFNTSYSVTPNIQASWIGAADNQNLRITAASTTGFTVLARNRVDIVGLLPTWTNVSGATIDVLITEK